jgi:hypothetical protein
MLQKEDSAHQFEQSALNSHKWIKKLTMILTSVLLLTMFGLGGYWLGSRREQPLPTDLISTPKPSGFPSVTPAQQLSSASARVISHATISDEAIYRDAVLEFRYPTQWKLYKDGQYYIKLSDTAAAPPPYNNFPRAGMRIYYEDKSTFSEPPRKLTDEQIVEIKKNFYLTTTAYWGDHNPIESNRE